VSAGAVAALGALVPGDLEASAHYTYEDRGPHMGWSDIYGPNGGATYHLLSVGLHESMQLEDEGWLDARLGLTLHSAAERLQLQPVRYVGADADADGDGEIFADGILEERAGSGVIVGASLAAGMKLPRSQELRSGIALEYAGAEAPALQRNVDASGRSIDLTPIQPPPSAADTSRLTLTADLEDEWHAIPQVDVTAGVRAQWWSDLDDPSLFNILNPRVELAVTPAEPVEISLLYGILSRPPTLAERGDLSAATLPASLSGDRFLGNAVLGPAATHTVELTTAWATRGEHLVYRGSASAAWTRLVDPIEAVDQGADLDTVTARPRVERLGLSIEGSVGLGGSSALFGAAWWASAADWSARSSSASTLLGRTPREGAVLGIDLEIGSWADGWLLVRYEGGRRNDRRTFIERERSWRLPAQTTFDAALRTRPIAGNVRLGASVHNLFDIAARDPGPRPDVVPGQVPREGRLVLLTIEMES
jgi:hypothetical protein